MTREMRALRCDGAGLQAREQVGDLLKQAPDRLVPALLFQFAPQDPHLARIGGGGRHARDVFRDPGAHESLRGVEKAPIELGELPRPAPVLVSVKLAQRVALADAL